MDRQRKVLSICIEFVAKVQVVEIGDNTTNARA